MDLNPIVVFFSRYLIDTQNQEDCDSPRPWPSLYVHSFNLRFVTNHFKDPFEAILCDACNVFPEHYIKSKSSTGNAPFTHSRVISVLLSSNYLPVDCGVFNQLVKLLLDGLLEGACLVSLQSILASESSFSRAQL